MSNRIFFKVAALTVLTLGVAACGGDGGGLGSGGGGAVPAQDSFFTAVNAVIASGRDDTDPREVDSITATSPEDSEPTSLDS